MKIEVEDHKKVESHIHAPIGRSMTKLVNGEDSSSNYIAKNKQMFFSQHITIIIDFSSSQQVLFIVVVDVQRLHL